MTEIAKTPPARRLENAFSLDSPAETFQDALESAKRAGQLPAWTQTQEPGTLAAFTRTIGDIPLKVSIESRTGLARIDLALQNGGRAIELTEFSADQLKAATVGLPPFAQKLVEKAIAALPRKQTRIENVVTDHLVKPSVSIWDRITGNTPTQAPAADVAAATGYEQERLQRVIDTFEAARSKLKAVEAKLPADETHAAFLATSQTFRKTLGQAVRAAGDDQDFMGQMRLEQVPRVESLVKEIEALVAKGDFLGAPDVIGPFEKRAREVNDRIVDGMGEAVRAGLAGSLHAVAGTNVEEAASVARSSGVAERKGRDGATVVSLRANVKSSPANVDDLERIFHGDSGGRSVATFLDLAHDVMGWDVDEPFAVFPRPEKIDEVAAGPESLYISPQGFHWREGVAYRDVTFTDLAGDGKVQATSDNIAASLETAAWNIEKGLREYFRSRAGDIESVTRADLFFALRNDVKDGVTQELRQSLYDCMKSAGFPIVAGAGVGDRGPQATQVVQPTASDVVGATKVVDLEDLFGDQKSSARSMATFLERAGEIMKWPAPQPYALFVEEKVGPTQLYVWMGGFSWFDGKDYRNVADADLAQHGAVTANIVESLDAAAEQVEQGLRVFYSGRGVDVNKMNRAALYQRLDADVKRGITDAFSQQFATAMADAGFPVG